MTTKFVGDAMARFATTISVSLAALLLAIVGLAARAAPVPPANDARAQQVAGREQTLAELDDPNPLRRLSTLEAILKSDDEMLTTLAVRKVFAGRDNDMKSLALRYRLSRPSENFILNIKACSGFQCEHHVQNLGNLVTVHFLFQNRTDDLFKIYSDRSMPANGQRHRVTDGKIHGDQIFMDIDLGMTSISDFDDCVGVMNLTPEGLLDGRLVCKAYQLAGEIDLR